VLNRCRKGRVSGGANQGLLIMNLRCCQHVLILFKTKVLKKTTCSGCSIHYRFLKDPLCSSCATALEGMFYRFFISWIGLDTFLVQRLSKRVALPTGYCKMNLHQQWFHSASPPQLALRRFSHQSNLAKAYREMNQVLLATRASHRE